MLASEIVEVVVVTTDAAFLQTLREAVGDMRRVWHVASADKVGELLVAGEVGILVVDAQTVTVPVDVWIAGIKRQLRDLVIVCAGTREVETALAESISMGLVYRFIHKPMSPARATEKIEPPRFALSRRVASRSSATLRCPPRSASTTVTLRLARRAARARSTHSVVAPVPPLTPTTRYTAVISDPR